MSSDCLKSPLLLSKLCASFSSAYRCIAVSDNTCPGTKTEQITDKTKNVANLEELPDAACATVASAMQLMQQMYI